MALKRLTRDHHNMHKRHLVIGDAAAVILALSKGLSSSQMAPICGAASAYVLPSFCQVSYRWCPASGTEQTSSRATVPCISGGHQSFRSMWSRSSPQTRSVSAPGLWNKRQKRAPSPASVPPSLSPSRWAAKRRCLSETLLTNCLSPQSHLMRQVELRRRRLQHHGHLDRAVLSRELRRSSRNQEDL